MTTETAGKPSYLGIPFFADSGLYLLTEQQPTPKSIVHVERNASVDLLSLGEYAKGEGFLIKPIDPSGRTFHFDHRSYLNPLYDSEVKPLDPNDLVIVRNEIESRKNTIIQPKHYAQLLQTSHKNHLITQQFIQEHIDMISRIIDPSPDVLTQPECFLEVGIKFINPRGEIDKKAIDLVIITHSGVVVLIEVASRKQINDNQTDEDLSRTTKYMHIVKISSKFKDQLSKKLNISKDKLTFVEACVFYEEINERELYTSFRFPQKIKLKP